MSKRAKLNNKKSVRFEKGLPPAVPETFNRDQLKLKPPPEMKKEDAFLTLEMIMDVKNGQRSYSDYEQMVSKRMNEASRGAVFTRDEMQQVSVSSDESDAEEEEEDEVPLQPAVVKWQLSLDPLKFMQDTELPKKFLEVVEDLPLLVGDLQTNKEWKRTFRAYGFHILSESDTEMLCSVLFERFFVGFIFKGMGSKQKLIRYCYIPPA